MAEGLPYDCQVEYIQSTGTQWIDTGVIGRDTTTFEVDFIPLSLPTAVRTGTGTILGNRYAYNSRVFHLSTFSNILTSLGTFAFGNNAYNSSNTPTLDLTTESINKVVLTGELISTTQSGAVTGHIMEIDNRKAVCYASSFSTPYTITVFALRRDNLESPMSEFIQMKLYYLRIDDLEFIPVIKDNIPCLYEKTNGTFYYNQGTGNFIAGPEVTPVPETTVKYVGPTGLTYLWSKIKATFAPVSEVEKIEGEYYNS